MLTRPVLKLAQNMSLLIASYWLQHSALASSSDLQSKHTHRKQYAYQQACAAEPGNPHVRCWGQGRGGAPKRDQIQREADQESPVTAVSHEGCAVKPPTVLPIPHSGIDNNQKKLNTHNSRRNIRQCHCAPLDDCILKLYYINEGLLYCPEHTSPGKSSNDPALVNANHVCSPQALNASTRSLAAPASKHRV